MPVASVDGIALNYEMTGPAGAPVVIFANSLGTTLEMWDDQVRALSGRYRCLRYDMRGHGGSAVLDAPATIDDLAGDLAGLMGGLGIARAHVVGLSIGGMAAQALAIRHPERVQALVLMATTAHLPPAEAWRDRARLVRTKGTAAIAEATLGRWFTPAFAAEHPQRLARLREQLVATDRIGYAVLCGAIAAMDLRAALGAIAAPTLVLAGREDPATPVAMAEDLAGRIAGAELVVIPAAAHLLAVQRPEIVSAHLGAFLDRCGPAARAGAAVGFAAGLATRQSVLGAAHVEASLAKAGAFAAPWQDFITRVAWGEIWGDPTLPRKTRSLLTLAMMIALHREEEFKLHVRPARANGVTLEELRALLLQSAIYAGVPAANAGFRWTREVLGDELG